MTVRRHLLTDSVPIYLEELSEPHEIPDTRAVDPAEAAHLALMRDLIHRGLRALDKNDRELLRARFGLGIAPRTVSELGRAMRVSHQAAGKRVEKALDRLREVMTLGHTIDEGKRQERIKRELWRIFARFTDTSSVFAATRRRRLGRATRAAELRTPKHREAPTQLELLRVLSLKLQTLLDSEGENEQELHRVLRAVEKVERLKADFRRRR